MKRVVIIGGGIAGLACAFRLKQRIEAARADTELLLLEADDRTGGKLVTVRADGFVVEGGPDSFIRQKPEGEQLCRDAGLGGQLQPSRDEQYRTRLLNRGRLTPFPDGFRLAVPTKLWPFVKSPLISPIGKLRMGLDLVLPRRREDGDESLSEFITRRLGREALERIAGPIMSGIYVGDPDRLSVRSTFPMFVELERKYGSLTRGILRARRMTRNRPAASVFVSLRTGMGALADALTSALGERVRLGVRVDNLTPEAEGGFSVGGVEADGARRTIRADHVVLCVPAHEAARLVRPWNPGIASELEAIRYAPSAVVSLAYPDQILKECVDGGGFGFVVPRRESSRILALTWSSRKFTDRAPEGHQLLRAFVGGARHPELAELSESEIDAMVREEIQRILGIRQPPLKTWVWKWPRGNPQFEVGHEARVDGLERRVLQIPGLHLAGAGYRGLGIPDCAKQALRVADRILSLARSGSAPV
ncbi:MAG: protoporphyrinogen oxidase [Kiritimatiellae bacterium]|nr:protoporphyrinogen oxidase [Kiritimatiellia bacterium]